MGIERVSGLPPRRIGDEERQACADLLAEHHARGRLSQDEFEERLGVALTAQTARDLGRVLVDLPSGSDGRPQRSSPPDLVASLLAMGGAAVAVVLVCSVLLLLVGESVADSVGGTLLLLAIPSVLGVVCGFLVASGVHRKREL